MFATVPAVRDWIEEQFGVVYTVGSMYTLLPRLGIRLKVRRGTRRRSPRPGRLGKRGLGARLA